MLSKAFMDINSKLKKKEEEVSSLSNVLQRYGRIVSVTLFIAL